MKYTIILDFDGTVVEHRYPKIGKPVPNALRVLERLQNAGITIVLNTARCEEKDNSFNEAREYMAATGIHMASCYMKKQMPIWQVPFGETIYIDDIAEGIPLIIDTGGIDMVDWETIEKLLEEHKII